MRRTVAAMAAAVAVAAFPCAAAAQAPAAPEPSAAVLAKYAAALQAVEAPKFVRFEYSVEQVGQRNIVQTHRVYRSGTRERDEILSVDGQSLPNPSVRIVSHRVDRYGIAAVAPQVKDYVFTFAGARRTAGHVEYSFSTAPRAAEAPAFGVTGVVIDDRPLLAVGRALLDRGPRAESRRTADVRAGGSLLDDRGGDGYGPLRRRHRLARADRVEPLRVSVGAPRRDLRRAAAAADQHALAHPLAADEAAE